NIRLDYDENKVNLYPVDQRKEDYVQTELRRLRENLHNESVDVIRKGYLEKSKIFNPFSAPCV
ncbi:unnamed protein product, partial [Rotaria sp. Silwood2]